jgi:phospholipase/carboxylesterase
MNSQRVTWGGLKCWVVHNLPEGKQPSLVAILCHGFGAPGTDLVPLADELCELAPELREEVLFVFPTAPLSLDDIGLLGGRAWWLIDLDRLINERTPETLLHFRTSTPKGLAESRGLILALIEHITQQFQLSPAQLLLGGFSQGAMLATDVALHLPQPPAALAILSGAVICQAEWEAKIQARGPLTVLQSHGTHDPILPFSEAELLRDMLTRGSSDVEFIRFPGEHGIPRAAFDRLGALLVRLLGNA